MSITLWGFWVPWSGVPFGNLGGISGGSWVNFGCEGYLFWGLSVTYWVFEYLLESRGSWVWVLWGVPLEVPEVPSRGQGFLWRSLCIFVRSGCTIWRSGYFWGSRGPLGS